MYPEFDCVDCGVSTFHGQYYMVHDHLWQQAGMEYDGGMLCILCLESRLGRLLVREDFTSAPVNYMFFSKNTERFPDGLTTYDEWRVV